MAASEPPSFFLAALPLTKPPLGFFLLEASLLYSGNQPEEKKARK
jgi:hypothetical protein